MRAAASVLPASVCSATHFVHSPARAATTARTRCATITRGMSSSDISWRSNIVSDSRAVQQLALSAKRVAVLGIKDEDKASQPAFFVPAYLQAAGVEVIPVPVFYPEATHILGRPVYRTVRDVPGVIDIVNIFRKPSDLQQHLDDILSAAPRAVWLQSGISDAAFEEALARAGIQVVADRCLKVEHQQASAASRM